VTLAAACVSGIVPALYGSHPALISQLRVARGSTHGRDWTRRALVVSQVALSLVLLVGAALMIRTFATLRPVSPGFAADDKVTAFVRLQGSAVPPQVFFDAFRDRLRVLPGVQSVSGSTYVPMSGLVSARRVSAGGPPVTAFSGAVTANYFDDMAIPIVEGRGFTAADVAGAPHVAIVNQTLARRVFARASPLGATLDMVPLEAAASDPRERVQIVGVTRDTRCSGADLTPCAEVYVPFAQAPEPGMTMFVRAVNPRDRRLADGIRAAAAAMVPAQVVDRLQPLQDMLDTRVATSRFGAWLLGTFAAIAVALAAIGIAASTAWWVGQRTREIGVRMALGAAPSRVVRGFVAQGLALALAGVLIGLAAAAATTRFLESWLYGVTPIDPLTFVLGSGALLGVSLAAAYLPARRAARVDPIVALRTE
jgi:putative ABC transport system permease protein